jgi:TatD DNase family protein
VALTSRCTNRCRFCPRVKGTVKGHYIDIPEDKEPDSEEVISAIGDPLKWDEVVFCGFGEPTLRLEVMLKVARWLKSQGVQKIRLNTNGQGNLINERDITPDLAGSFDSISISLNESRADLYQAISQSEFGEAAFEALLDFTRRCVTCLPEVVLTVVSYPGVDVEAARSLAQSLGAGFRAREYNEVGCAEQIIKAQRVALRFCRDGLSRIKTL